ncbi:DMT family transporter [Tuanshanicoccus lijuaniae]|uniref:DMT family transporter n=1 Tax=Aerococcaceae bacterium zg-1292 TaxID=2774330 RepID=UPI001935C3AB|nr:DMT family transporter [Aerococcaceae bacterium zg-1292]MBF6625077.1 DMT family transporter [Aerococcaceae bacterium zg-BR9]MBF6978193.1 DMT family transporter [Aerococcaceae bacterium zg-BR22]MBS4456411.1 DMT family transporter [Aerococcaceae bacterium zg-A91]MBS4458261.1 DMT family transporter [Aerococcaceae bacterium zg-BR33]
MSNYTKGVLSILMSAFGFALMNLFIPLSGALPTIQKSFFRNLVALFIALIVLWRTNRKKPVREFQEGESIAWKWLFVRSIFGTIGIWCNFYAIDHLFISDASVLNKISPFATLVFSYLFLKEPMKRGHLVALFFAFVGVLLVVKPTLANTDFFPYFMGIIGGISSGAAYTTIRKLNKENVTPAVTIAFFSLFSCVASLPQLILSFEPMSLRSMMMLALVGGMAAIGQFGITMAYKFAPASQISVFDYTMIIFTGMLGFIFLHQVPDYYSIIGYAIIIFAGWLSFKVNQQKLPS